VRGWEFFGSEFKTGQSKRIPLFADVVRNDGSFFFAAKEHKMPA
jgi:hypothetical protein